MLTRVSQAITITFFLYLIAGMNNFTPTLTPAESDSATTASQQTSGVKFLLPTTGTIKPRL